MFVCACDQQKNKVFLHYSAALNSTDNSNREKKVDEA